MTIDSNGKMSFYLHPIDGFILTFSLSDLTNAQLIIPEIRVWEKLYHAQDFGIELPSKYNQNLAKKMSCSERVEYGKNTVPIEVIRDLMISFGKHLKDPLTKFSVGSFGVRRQESWGRSPITGGIHAYNKTTKNDLFFRPSEESSDEFIIYEFMELSRSRADDLEENNNLL